MKQPYFDNVPTIFTVFGATGDLMTKKIVPSLYFLYKQKKLPVHFDVLGFARRAMSDEEFRTHVFNILKEKEFVKTRQPIEKFLKLFHYEQGDFSQLQDYTELKSHIQNIQDQWGICANKLYYLAVPPAMIKPIAKGLKETKLNLPCDDSTGWARVIVEKPFGDDGASAKELEKTLSVFKREQIYRIDHYFGKEMVQGILNFRFSNGLFENAWNNKHIERISMKLWEEIGVETRGSFYESVGALRDVGQNHLLSILALLTMEHPINYTDKEVRNARAEVLKQLIKPSLQDIKTKTFRAQYDGYKNITGVNKNSNVETYFRWQTELDSPRWTGVPITIESGKRMGQVKKEIVVTFRHPEPCICPPAGPVQNKIIFKLHPTQEIKIQFWQRKPGFDMQLEKREFVFMLHKNKTKLPYVEEYAKLLHDTIAGNQTWFMRNAEIAQMWRVVDPIINAWKNNLTPLHTYKPDTFEITKTAKNFLEEEKHKLNKRIGIIGLGKMGGNLARRLIDKGWYVVGYNRTAEVTRQMAKENLNAVYSLEDMIKKLPSPRIIWLMLPNGKPIDETLFGKEGIVKKLDKGDIIIDGGNSYFKDTTVRANKLKKLGIKFLDAGVSGGPGGARNGACIMIGGEKKLFEHCEPIFKDMSQVNGYQFFSGAGAGHFVKMIHNGIEYGMMQAIGEGFNVLKKSDYKLDLHRIADIYNEGSVIESRLVGWLHEAFHTYGTNLEKISGKVSHSGEGEWTIKTAKAMKIKTKVIEESLKFRKQSQKNPDYTGQIVSALRGQFGQHPVLEK
ncbi:MAG: glucose-6-phosphate dehydrogenase [Candidatus Magasanikiibacteriota bacterium]